MKPTGVQQNAGPVGKAASWVWCVAGGGVAIGATCQGGAMPGGNPAPTSIHFHCILLPSVQVDMEFTALRTPLGREFVPAGFLQARGGRWGGAGRGAACTWRCGCRRAPACPLPHLCTPRYHLPPHNSPLPLLLPTVQAAESAPEAGGLGSQYAFRQRFYSTLPDTFDNNLRVGGWTGTHSSMQHGTEGGMQHGGGMHSVARQLLHALPP